MIQVVGCTKVATGTSKQCCLQVLAGVHIMFSRVIPLQEGRPEQHPMWRKAIKFGATCTTQPSDTVTHVAAYVNGTEKVRALFPAGSV